MPRWPHKPATWKPTDTAAMVTGHKIHAHADYVGPAEGPSRFEWVSGPGIPAGGDNFEIKPTAWKVTLTYQGSGETFDFHQGSAHTKPPTAATVLECLLMDSYAATLEFGDFANEFGLNTDAGKALETYQAVQENDRKLRRLLGSDAEKFREYLEQYDEIPEAVL